MIATRITTECDDESISRANLKRSTYLSVTYDDLLWLLDQKEPLADENAVPLNQSVLINRALSQAQHSHRMHTRESGGDYLSGHIYPVAASYILHERLQGVRVQAKGIAAAVTHDTEEDDDEMTGDKFNSRFGQGGMGKRVHRKRSVAVMVELLTNKDPELYGGDKKAAKEAYLRQLFSEPTPAISLAINSALNGIVPDETAIRIARQLKGHDRNHNTYTLHGCRNAGKILRKIEETEKYFLEPIRRVSPIISASIGKRIADLKEWIADGSNPDRFFSAIPEWWWDASPLFCERIARYNLSVGFRLRPAGGLPEIAPRD